MKKLVNLTSGALFVEKGGLVRYLSNDQLNKTGREFNKKTEQYETIPDAVMSALKNQEPLEEGGTPEPVETPKSERHKVLSPAEKALLREQNQNAGKSSRKKAPAKTEKVTEPGENA